ncbi:MAG: FAD-dependent monooxygenase, partial [Pseudomonadota bacterium]
DGRNSPMRQAAGIEVMTTRYGQKALAFAVTHDAPHDNISTEVHQSGGPFTLVPLPDHDGKSSSAIVWMDDAAKTDARATMPEAAFEAEMTARSCEILGPLRLASRRTTWPIISQRAKQLVGQRLALIAEAAHVVPPIGAQGLNMSLADTGALLDLAQAKPETLGDAQMLQAYERARLRDIQVRVAGIDLLNRASQLSAQPLRDARAAGLRAIYAAGPVRKMLMRMGLGLRRFS